MPVFLGFAALHTNLRELGSGAPAIAVVLLAVTAVKFAAAYGASRATGLARSGAGVVAAMLQCGGVMTSRSRSRSSTPTSSRRRRTPP